MNDYSDDVRAGLQALCIPKVLKGYALFYNAVEIFYQKPEASITKDVYYALSKKYHLSESQVEGRIRTIIKYLWKNRDLSAYGFYLEGNCPSNKNFIVQVAHFISEARE